MSHEFIRRWAVPLLAVPVILLGCETAKKIGHGVSDSLGAHGHGDAARVGHAAVEAGSEAYQAAHYSDLSEQEEYYLGRATAANFFTRTPRAGKAERLTDYVARIGNTLALASSRPQTFRGYRFAVVRSDEVNAFSAPGGFIFVTTGTIEAARSEDELAGVLAHEIAHVAERHALQMISDAHLKASALAVTRGVGDAAAARHGAGEMRAAVKFTEGILGDIVEASMAGFGRDKESEADRIAAEMMANAGYDPTALASFIGRMQNHEKTGGWFATNRSLHPSVAERVSALNAQCAAAGWASSSHTDRDARFTAMARGH